MKNKSLVSVSVMQQSAAEKDRARTGNIHIRMPSPAASKLHALLFIIFLHFCINYTNIEILKLRRQYLNIFGDTYNP